MYTILKICLLIVAGIDVFCIGFLQTSKANGLSALTGEGLALFEQTKVRGTEKNIQNIVKTCTILLFIGLLVSLYIA